MLRFGCVEAVGGQGGTVGHGDREGLGCVGRCDHRVSSTLPCPLSLNSNVCEATPTACTLNLHINTSMLRFECVEAVGGQGGTVVVSGGGLLWDVLGI